MRQTFVIGILVRKNECLAKKRRFWKEVKFVRYFKTRYEEEVFFPKAIIREGETPEIALERAVKTDFGVRVLRSRMLGEFLYRDGCKAKVFLIHEWDGDFKNLRGQGNFLWVSKSKEFTNEFDKNLLIQVIRELDRLS